MTIKKIIFNSIFLLLICCTPIKAEILKRIVNPNQKPIENVQVGDDMRQLYPDIGDNVYTGQKIVIDSHKTNITNILKTLQQVNGNNYAVDKDVSMEIAISMEEPTPWDQVLDLILEMNKLVKVEYEGIIRIAKIETIRAEEKAFQKKHLALRENVPKKVYTGQKIALDFHQTNIKNVLKILQQISGKNYVVDKDVTGEATILIKKPIPWDQALDLILEMNQLDKMEYDDIFRIVTVETMNAEKREKAHQEKISEIWNNIIPKKLVYTGKKIDVGFDKTDIRVVFQILQQCSGKQFIIHNDVNCQITYTIDKPLPWDQVLDIILQMHMLGRIVEGDTIRIATLKTLFEEEYAQQKQKGAFTEEFENNGQDHSSIESYLNSGVKKHYTGQKIALDFYEKDIKQIFTILQQVSGKIFTVDKDVIGEVTISLIKPLPWDQVLDVILQMNQLCMAKNGEDIMILSKEMCNNY